jgi:hypothetical protein
MCFLQVNLSRTGIEPACRAAETFLLTGILNIQNIIPKFYHARQMLKEGKF